MKIEELLRKHQLQPTAMRLLVLSYLQELTAAISLTSLYDAFENSDRTTLYRTLKSFEDKGLVHSIIDKAGITQYALCHAHCDTHEHNDAHIHFYCTKCQSTYCLPKWSIPSFELPKAFKKESVKLMVEGICENCSS